MEATLAHIRTLLASGRRETAIAAAETAIGAGLEHPFLFNLAALPLEQAGRYEDAERLLKRALALAPQDLASLHALGLCLLQQERFADAADQFAQVIAGRPDAAPAHANHAAALEGMGRMEEAEAAYRRALVLRPDLVTALLGRARLALRRGQPGEALESVRAVLSAHPDLPDARLVLSEAELASGQADAAARRLRELLDHPGATPPQRALACGLLGDALDRLERTPEAFAAYTQANEALRTLYAGRFGRGQSLNDYAAVLERWVAAIPGEALSARPPAPWAGGPAAHVFLLGFPRSGTTLLEQVLASHPQVVALEERETLLEGALRFLAGGEAGLNRLAAADDAELDALRRAYWGRVEDDCGPVGGKVFIDKHPLNTLKLPLIARLFPEAKVLFAIRDPRDVVLSCFRRRFRMNNAMYQLLTLEGAADLYARTMNIALMLEARLGLPWRRVAHEALVTDFDGEVSAICAFLGLPWREELRAFAARARKSATPSAAQVARGLNREGVGFWRRYADHLAPVTPRLRPFVETFGYPD